MFAWVNDADTLRTYASKTDAYSVLRSMLDKDKPPDEGAALLKSANDLAPLKRLRATGPLRIATRYTE